MELDGLIQKTSFGARIAPTAAEAVLDTVEELKQMNPLASARMSKLNGVWELQVIYK